MILRRTQKTALALSLSLSAERRAETLAAELKQTNGQRIGFNTSQRLKPPL